MYLGHYAAGSEFQRWREKSCKILEWKKNRLSTKPPHKSDEQELSPWQHWEPENDEAISLMLSPKNWF